MKFYRLNDTEVAKRIDPAAIHIFVTGPICFDPTRIQTNTHGSFIKLSDVEGLDIPDYDKSWVYPVEWFEEYDYRDEFEKL